jgi:8-amino-7-oxononanoate synthase
MKRENIPQVISKIRKEHRFRSVSDLRMISAVRGINREGQHFLVFNSNDYLGMTHEKDVIEAARKAAFYGTGSGGARLTSGAVFELSELEKELADFKGKEAALVFNTGYMTNLGVLYALAGPGDVIFSDALNHASIVDGCRISRAHVVVYPHGDMEWLDTLMRETPVKGQRFIVTDGVFSMDGDIAPLPELITLKKKYGAMLIVDDAHATGVVGETGRGTAEYWHVKEGIDVTAGTLSKALGSEGGFAAADREIVEYLINRSRPFIFSTAVSPVTAASALTALRLLKSFPEKYMGTLRENTRYMREKLKEKEIPVIPGDTPIIPILLGDEGRALQCAQFCRDRGILLSAIRPPSVPEGTSRLRLTVTAAHTKENMDRAADVLSQFGW